MDYERSTILNKIQHWLFNKPKCATSKEWYIYETETSKKYPKLFFILEIIPRKCRRWWFQNITERKLDLIAKYKQVHHIVLDIDRFPISHIDRKYWNYGPHIKMLHANFQILVDTYEKLAPEIIEYRKTISATHKDAWTEFELLYNWWTVNRPSRNTNFPRLEDFDGLVNYFWGINEHGVNGKNKQSYIDYKAAVSKSQEQRGIYDLEDKEMLLRLITYSNFLF